MVAEGFHRQRQRQQAGAHQRRPVDRGGLHGTRGARHGAAVATVRDHHDAHVVGELRPQLVDLVVDQHAVVQAQGLVGAVVLIGIEVRHLAAVAGVGEHEHVAGLELGRGIGDGALDRIARGLLVEQHGALLEAALGGDALHVLGVEMAAEEIGVAAVVAGVDLVEADVHRPAAARGRRGLRGRLGCRLLARAARARGLGAADNRLDRRLEALGDARVAGVLRMQLVVPDVERVAHRAARIDMDHARAEAGDELAQAFVEAVDHVRGDGALHRAVLDAARDHRLAQPLAGVGDHVVVAVADRHHAGQRLDVAQHALVHRQRVIEQLLEARQHVRHRRQRGVEVAQVGAQVAAAERVVAARREQEDRGLGLADRVDILAILEHVLERVAGGVQAAHREALRVQVVDRVLELDRVLEPRVALGYQHRPLIAVGEHAVEADAAAHARDAVGEVHRRLAARAPLGGVGGQLDRGRVELQLGVEQPGVIVVGDEVHRQLALGDGEVGELAVEFGRGDACVGHCSLLMRFCCGGTHACAAVAGKSRRVSDASCLNSA